MFGEVFKLFGSIGVDMSQIDKAFDDLSSKLKTKGKDFEKAGKNLSLKLTTPIIGIGTAAFMTGANFEEAMSKVQAISGATGGDIQSLTDLARHMGATTKFSATQSAEALTYMAMAGWDTESMLDGLNGIMLLSASSGEDLAMVSDIVTDALTAFGMSADESTKFADLLSKTSSSANTNVGMLGESFKYVAPLFGSLGYSAEDASLALGLMANAGIKGSQAGTSLRSAVSRLVNPIGEAGGLIKEMGIEVSNADGSMRPFRDIMGQLRERFKTLTPEQQAQTAATLFGQEAMSGMLAIINANEEDFGKLSEATTNYTGTAQEMADVMMDNSKGSLQIFKSALEEMFIALSEHIIPVVTRVIEKLTEWVTWFGNLDDGTQKTILVVMALLAALGPTLLILGKVLAVISALTPVFIGVTAAIKGVTLATGASKISMIAYKITQMAMTAASSAYTFATGLATAATSAFGAVMAFVTSPIGLVVLAIVALIGIVYLLIKNWDTVKDVTSKVWNSIKDTITNTISSAVDFVKKMIDKLKGFFNFKWKLPELKMPKVEIIGKFSLLPPSVPKFNLKWNAKGGIMTDAMLFGSMGNTLLGGGEAGDEAILPLTRDVLGGIGEGIVASTDMGNNSTLLDKLDAIIELLLELIGIDPKYQILLDSGALVGELTPLIDQRMGRRAERKMRGG